MKKPYYLFALLGLGFSSCQSTSTSHYDGSRLDSSAIHSINEQTFRNYVTTLASDNFLGRKPFTKGDTLTVNYIEKEFKTIGLQPGNGDSYFQEVPLVEINSVPNNKELIFQGANGELKAMHLDDYVIGSSKLEESIEIPKTDLVFAGFGIVAPEYNWNDYEGLDVKGKTVVVMVSDPGRYDTTLFKADTMTYYGRWVYKFEEAARQGATGVLLIHETSAASYGWNVVRNGWSGSQLGLIEKEGAQQLDFKGWISNEIAQKLFQLADINPNIVEQAKKPGFKAVDLKVSTTVSLTNTFKKSKSNNVVAKIEGSKRPDEVIIYTAHWDHLGVGEATEGDSIFNGAIDNATGVAALFEIAKAFQVAKVKPKRSIIFLALTAEEEGLLGSAYYAENPIYSFNKTVANLNMDMFNPIGAMNAVSIIGIGQTELEDYASKSASKFNRKTVGESDPSAGLFYRSDHFSFVKKGVPGLFMGSGGEYISQDTLAISIKKKALEGIYHTVADEVNEHWDFEGILEDVRVFFDIGYTLSMEKTFPNFKQKSEFKELGDKRLSK